MRSPILKMYKRRAIPLGSIVMPITLFLVWEDLGRVGKVGRELMGPEGSINARRSGRCQQKVHKVHLP